LDYDKDQLKKFRDHKYRVANFYRIIDKDANKIPFRPNCVQQKLMDQPPNALTGRLMRMTLKARQFGVSTYEIIRITDLTMWKENQTNMIMAHEKDAIKKLFRIVRRVYDFMPEQWRPRLAKGGGSQYELYFPDLNSRIYCDLETRGDTLQNLHISEAAFSKEDRIKATLEAARRGNTSMETTANGIGGYFHEMWTDKGREYTKFFFPWYIFAEYADPINGPLKLTSEEEEFVDKAKRLFGVDITHEQIEFRRNAMDRLGSLYLQEYPEDDATCFLTTGDMVFNAFVLKEMLHDVPTPISDSNDVRIYKEKVLHHVYVIGADCAQGTGGDKSAAQVIDITSNEVVATIQCDVTPSEFADKLYDIGKLYVQQGYIWPRLYVERNNHGHAVLLKLSEYLFYPNLFRTDDDKLGWLTDKITKPIMISALQDAIANRHIQINDKKTILELLTFINNDGKQEAAEGKNDDLVIALAIAVQGFIFEKSNVDFYNNIESKLRV